MIATANPHAVDSRRSKVHLKRQVQHRPWSTITDDYFIPNEAVSNGEADANFFQHVPFFDKEKNEKNYKIANVGGVHIEPFGIYSKTIKNVSDIKDGSTVVISNSVADNGRILAILAQENLVKLPETQMY